MTIGPFLTCNAAGHLEIDGCDATALAEEFGTPLWVISENTIRHNYRELRDAFIRRYARTRIAYASKANPEPAISRIAKLEGALLDAVTMGHIRLLLSAGVSPSEIIFNGNSKTAAELRWAAENEVHAVNVDSLAELEMIARLRPPDASPMRVCLRLAADEERFAAEDPEFARHLSQSKFGMDAEDALRAADLAASNEGISLEGLHHHIGWPAYGVPYSAELDLARHRRSVEQVLEFAALLTASRDIQIHTLNFGGGFRTGRREGFGPGKISAVPSVDEYAEAVVGRAAELIREYRLGEPELLFEAGGYLVANAVVFLARVNLTKRRNRARAAPKWVFVENASGYHFVRRLMHGFDHHVVAANKLSVPPSEVVNIGGPVCAEDSLARDVACPVLEPGDLVAVLDQGAYCEAVTSDYCAVPIPAVVLASAGRVELTRRRETLDDLVARFAVPSWLA